MLCRCGNEIENMPEHLKDLVEWVCQKCTNTAPKSQVLPFEVEPPRNRRFGFERQTEDAKVDAA